MTGTGTAESLITAMNLLNATRCMVTVTDWQNPAQIVATEEGVSATLGLVMSMLEQVADGIGCRAEADQRIKAGTDRAWSIIACYQGGGRA